jgi:hypothetical protein
MAYDQRAYSGQPADEESKSRPWVVGFAVFGGAMMIMAGMFEMFQGLAAILEDEFFIVGREYAYTVDVTTYGWVHFILGIVVSITGFGVLTGALWARILGIIVTVLVAIANFFTIPYYPVWSILVIATSIVVVWALASMKGELSPNDFGAP